MTFFAFEEHLHTETVHDVTPCDYCGANIADEGTAYFDDVTGHEFCSTKCGAKWLSYNVPL